ncbi:MAG: hypothetical protein WAM91_10720 [Candidatus Acidiferrales bacterium]
MNKLRSAIIFAALSAVLTLIVVSAHAQSSSSTPSDEFFVVSSVDRAHNALILLKPTEIATVFQTTDKTQFFDEQNKALKLSDFRAGDTIFASYQSKPDGTLTLVRVRKGDMTVNELRRRYVPGLPVNAGQTSQTISSPKSTAPKSNNSTSNTAKSSNTASSNAKSRNSKSTSTTTKSSKPKSGTAKPNSSTTTPPKPKQQTSH